MFRARIFPFPLSADTRLQRMRASLENTEIFLSPRFTPRNKGRGAREYILKYTRPKSKVKRNIFAKPI